MGDEDHPPPLLGHELPGEAQQSDPVAHVQPLRRLVEELRQDRGIAVVSAVHDLTLAAQYADRLALLDHGALVAEGDAEAVLTTERLERFSGARVAVIRGPDGAIVVAPVRQA